VGPHNNRSRSSRQPSDLISFAELDRFTDGKLGKVKVKCPVCGPTKKRPRSAKRKVMAVWRRAGGFAGYHCKRCGISGYALDRNAPPLDEAAIRAIQAKIQVDERDYWAKRRALAQWLWGRRRAIRGTVVETYLRDVRAIHGPLPATLGYLPPWRDRPPALIAAFGPATELELADHQRRWWTERHQPLPSALTVDLPRAAPCSDIRPIGATLSIAEESVTAVQVTELMRDGSGKATSDDDDYTPRRTIGSPSGQPIWLSPMDDLAGLVIVEGVESGLSLVEATGLCTWASGGTTFLPKLVDAVAAVQPDFTTVRADDDDDGRRYALELVGALRIEKLAARAIIGRQP
jgi:hypothetical protein